ncbi:hypothetical protein P4159_05945 [Bacillus thuringiensis]|uniref:hypothetical protein n=1 Tax=Bacillus cereus group TaxID=86661 RepID=UPI000CD9E394|nr:MULTISPECIES: hypothetical protein [Bacillus cereus group]MEC3420819.1 hypothetical protein [Bacillus cereus]MEC3596950.1 hypothetical protein [Bacillus thuringiensis]MED1574299.1 hypothetical protein [Bacillus paranthracis]MED1836223.1 hypothetical protein [Bacillus thuringiensis]MED2670286.1 hypothetical protein [Bacillus thuringiensis]
MAKPKNYDPLVVKLYHETDKDIIDFLDEKDANTFVTKEALRMFIKKYRMMENMTNTQMAAQTVSIDTPPPVPEAPVQQAKPKNISDVFKNRQQDNSIIGK